MAPNGKILEFLFRDALKTWFEMIICNFQKRAWETFSPLVTGLHWSDDNIKKFNARLLFASTAKVDNNYSSSKLTSSFFLLC